MPAKATPKRPPAARKRRTSDEARSQILDAAERMLLAAGPGGIRLQQIAQEIGVAHPTVLHHFGSREKLVQAVVTRATDRLRARLVDAVRGSTPTDPDQVRTLLEGVIGALVGEGSGRALMWLALEGYEPQVDTLRLREIADAVHEVRRERRRAKGKRTPGYEDTYFTVKLAALALLALSVLEVPGDREQPERFHVWLARLLYGYLEEG